MVRTFGDEAMSDLQLAALRLETTTRLLEAMLSGGNVISRVGVDWAKKMASELVADAYGDNEEPT